VTPFLRLCKRLWERVIGTWDEGPEPPVRLREAVLMFANMHPRATRRDWVNFASHFAGESYRTGFIRGWEMDVRTAEHPWKGEPPELMANMLDPGWSWAPEVLLHPEQVPAASSKP
jgi:hypothetical protein